MRFNGEKFVDSAAAVDCVIVAAVLAATTMFSLHRLDGTPWAIDFSAALAGVRTSFPATFPAALKIWSCWAIATAIGAGILLKFDSEIGLLDAILGGAGGAWVAAFVLGQILGPIGLFRAPVIWILLAAGAVWMLMTPTRIEFPRIGAGLALAALALLLALVGLLPLQLASPVVPYMDVLSYPASVQRILSFGRYLPFDNDPYGCWGAQAQTPGFELFLAMLAMGSRVSLGVLAQSAALVPMAGLMIFATYRLGAATVGDAGGGIAALMLFFTNTFRRMVGMRGTAVALALVALGLAFMLDRRSRRALVGLGALILATAVASHAIEGVLAIAVAAIALACRDATRPRILFLEYLCLAGAGLVAAPELAIATRTALPYPILPLLQVGGIAAIVLAARALPQPLEETSKPARWRDVLIVVIFAAALIYTSTAVPDSIFAEIFQQFPILSVLAAVGIVIIAALPGAAAEIDGSALVIALLMTIVVEAIARKLGAMPGAQAFHAAVTDLHFKLDEYWTPYFMVFPAALPFALLLKSGRRAVVAAAVIVILVYPWNPRPNGNYDYEEHSIAENWGIDLGIAARGYWFSTPDARWTMGPNELALVDLLRAEQSAGRITLRTHILHIARDVIVWRDFNRFSVYTGINDDPIVYDIPPSDLGWVAGGRVKLISALPDALAQRPPYILVQVAPPPSVRFPPEGYDLIFHRGNLRLFRRRDLVALR